MLRPTVWNGLPLFVRTADSFTSFRSQPKTYYVCKAFVGVLVCSWYSVRASDTLTILGLSRDINSLLTYLSVVYSTR